MTLERLFNFRFDRFQNKKVPRFASKLIRTHFLVSGSFCDKTLPLFIASVFSLYLYNHTFKTILLIKRAKKPRDGNFIFCLYLKAVP